MDIMAIIGVLIGVGILLIVAWAVQEILKYLGITIHPIVRIIVIAIIGIIALLLLAQILGAPVAFFRRN